MWMLMGLMGMLVASSVADAFMKYENGNQGGTGEPGADDAPDDPWGDAAGGAAETGSVSLEQRGDLLAPEAQGEAQGEVQDEARASDPWLGEWREDGYVSDDTVPPAPDEPGAPPAEPPAPPTEPAEPDPWLDGWHDDSFTSNDDTPDMPGEPDADPGDDRDPGNDAEIPDAAPADPWLDGWRDDSYVSSDIPEDLAALAGGAQAVHVLGAGELFDTGGSSGAFVIGDWIGDGDPPVIRSFNPLSDRLIFAFDEALGPPEITVRAGDESAPALLMIDAQPVLAMEGVRDLDAGSIRLYPVSLDT